MHRVGKPTLLAHFEEKSTRHPGTEDGREHGKRELVFVEIGIRRNADDEVCLIRFLLPYGGARFLLHGRESNVGRRFTVFQPAKFFLDLCENLLIIERSRDRDDCVEWGVVPLMICREILAAERANIFLGPEDSAPERMLLSIDKFVEYIVYCAHGHVLVHVYLLDDSAALFLDLLFGKRGIEKDIAYHVERYVEELFSDLGKVGGPLFCRESVVHGSHAIELFAYRARTRALLRPLEEHVLQKVREAILVPIFISRTSTAHHHHSRRPIFRHLREYDPEAVWERVDVVVH